MADIPFTQYLLPDGKRRKITFPASELEEGVLEMAQYLLDNGCRFDAEILQTGMISFTCERDDDLISIQLCPNNPQVVASVNKLIKQSYEILRREQNA